MAKRPRITKYACCQLCDGPINRGARPAAFCIPCMHKAERIRNKGYAVTHRRINSGEIPPAHTLNCVDCGEKAKFYDHRSYFPEVIEPVCHGCNVRRGPANYRSEAA